MEHLPDWCAHEHVDQGCTKPPPKNVTPHTNQPYTINQFVTTPTITSLTATTSTTTMLGSCEYYYYHYDHYYDYNYYTTTATPTAYRGRPNANLTLGGGSHLLWPSLYGRF